MVQFEALSVHKCQSSDQNHARIGMRCVEGGLGTRLLEKSVVPVKAGRDVRMNVRISRPEEVFFSIKNATDTDEMLKRGGLGRQGLLPRSRSCSGLSKYCTYCIRMIESLRLHRVRWSSLV
jgi:hypothetical protein